MPGDGGLFFCRLCGAVSVKVLVGPGLNEALFVVGWLCVRC